MSAIPLGRRQRKNHANFIVPAVSALLALLFTVVYFVPGFLRQPLNLSQDTLIYHRGYVFQEAALYKGDMLYLPLSFIRDEVDNAITWDEKNKIVVITTTKEVYHLPLGAAEGLQNLQSYTLTYPVLMQNGTVYLPTYPLKDIYQLDILEQPDRHLVRVLDLGQPVQTGRVIANSKLRVRPGLRSPWTERIESDASVVIQHENAGWYWIETSDGRMGYLDKNKVSLTETKAGQASDFLLYQPYNPVGQPLLMTWEYAGDTTPDFGQNGEIPGIHVLSPTWFHLAPGGEVINKADKAYVKAAHQSGRQVWGLFDNAFDPEQTHDFLDDASLRIRAIRQLLSYVDLYELDGINIDFENVYLQDKEAFVQFLRELTPLMHEKGRNVSVDVTFHSLSETWSMFLDRRQIARTVDYLMVMAYDENGKGSPQAGSVGSLTWVEEGLQKMLSEVPADKLILGVPFYTRLWAEETDGAGKKKVTSRVLDMEEAARWVREHQAQVKVDPAAGQHYAETSENGITYKIWLEDEYSLGKRAELLKKYGLAGLASWRRGFESPGIWPALNKILNKY